MERRGWQRWRRKQEQQQEERGSHWWAWWGLFWTWRFPPSPWTITVVAAAAVLAVVSAQRNPHLQLHSAATKICTKKSSLTTTLCSYQNLHKEILTYNYTLQLPKSAQRNPHLQLHSAATKICTKKSSLTTTLCSYQNLLTLWRPPRDAMTHRITWIWLGPHLCHHPRSCLWKSHTGGGQRSQDLGQEDYS